MLITSVFLMYNIQFMRGLAVYFIDLVLAFNVFNSIIALVKT